MVSKSEAGPDSGTIGGGVSSQVIQNIDEIIKYTKMKNAALNYLSQRVSPSNIDALQKALGQMDADNCGYLPNEAFVRCLS